MIELTLYTTAGCHLRDLAEAILHAISKQYNISIIYTEIGDDDALVERYGIRIPVVKLPNNVEINWPFDQNDLEIKLAELALY